MNKSAVQRRHIPLGAVEKNYPAANLVAYFYESQQRPCLMVYKGRQTKPIQCVAFTGIQGESTRARHVEALVKRHTDDLQWTLARRNARHELQVGDVLFRTWGYEQTNVDFYQVVRVPSDRSVVLRQLQCEVVSCGDSMSGKATPQNGKFVEKAQERIHRATGAQTVGGGRDYGGDLALWDGRPQNVTSYA
jgi:hypothetical protein